jgi:hypothetical protein
VATRQASTTAGEAPVIEEAMYDGLLISVEEKRVKGGQYTKDLVNGDLKLEWSFLSLDEEGNFIPAIDKDGNALTTEDGTPKNVIVSKLTGVGFNIASKTVPQEVRMLKALLTKDEYVAFENGEGTPDDAVRAKDGGLLGRKVQTEVFVKENGWPGVGNVVAPRGGQKGTDFLGKK